MLSYTIDSNNYQATISQSPLVTQKKVTTWAAAGKKRCQGFACRTLSAPTRLGPNLG